MCIIYSHIIHFTEGEGKHLVNVQRYTYMLRLYTAQGKKMSLLMEDEEQVHLWSTAIRSPTQINSVIDTSRVAAQLAKSVENINSIAKRNANRDGPFSAGFSSPFNNLSPSPRSPQNLPCDSYPFFSSSGSTPTK